MKTGERIKRTLSVAGITPRHLGGATRIHFVTIYRAMNHPENDMAPLTEHTLTEALDKLDKLVEDGKLPIREKLSRKEKTDRLKTLLAVTKR